MSLFTTHSATKTLLTPVADSNAQFGAPLDTPIDPYFFDDLVNGAYGNRAKAIIASRLYDPALYPGDDSVREAFVDLGTDFNW